jgi:surface protein
LIWIFKFCNSLKSLNVSNFNVSNVNSFNQVFAYCYALESLDLSNWNIQSSAITSELFNKCSALSSLTLGNRDDYYDGNIENIFSSPSSNCKVIVPSSSYSNWSKVLEAVPSSWTIEVVKDGPYCLIGQSNSSYEDAEDNAIELQDGVIGSVKITAGMTNYVFLKGAKLQYLNLGELVSPYASPDLGNTYYGITVDYAENIAFDQSFNTTTITELEDEFCAKIRVSVGMSNSLYAEAKMK